MNGKSSLKPLLTGAALLLAFAAFSLPAPATAETLDAKTLSGLVSGHTWKQVNTVSGGYLYWAWNTDGAVCLRQEATGSCMDTGRWKLDGDSVCHELSWWGKSSGSNVRCYRVAGKGEGHYEMIPVDGVTTFEFTILKQGSAFASPLLGAGRRSTDRYWPTAVYTS